MTTTGSYSSAVNSTSFPLLGGTSVSSAYVDTSLVFDNSYTFAFYNGNTVGVSTILQDASNTLNNVSVTLNTFYDIVSALSSSGTTNTSTNIDYTITNDLATDTIAYLYRFTGNITVPTTLNTSLTGAVNVTAIPVYASTPVSSSYFDPTLSQNTVYTYALYNGTSNGTSILLTDANGTGQSTVVSTSNIYDPSLTSTSIYTNSVTLAYTLNNNPSSVGTTAYLYRFSGSSAPTTLSGGYNIISDGVPVLQNATVSSSVVDSGVVPDSTYTYAFYSGNVDGSSVILQDTSATLQNVSLTVSTFYDIIVYLTASGTTNNSTTLNYSVQNILSGSTPVYFYRFLGNIIPPATLNTGLSGATLVTNITIDPNATSTSTYPDSGLSSATTYTYALYTGTTNGVSILLTDINDNGQYVSITTGAGSSDPVVYDINASLRKNTSVEIILNGIDPNNLALTYTYGSPSNGYLLGSAPNLTYVPNTDFTGTDSFTYYATNTNSLQSNTATVNFNVSSGDVICFKRGTQILCAVDGQETQIKVEDLKPGDLVKTTHGRYVPVNLIGYSTINNSGDSVRTPNRLYKCAIEKFPGLFEDLYITGFHCILVDKLSESEKENILDAFGKLFITDNKFRLAAYLDDRAEPCNQSGEFEIWHFALDHDNMYMNYGVWANGLLVESCSKRFLTDTNDRFKLK